MRRQVAYVEGFAKRSIYGFGQEFHIIEKLYYIFAFFKITYFGYQVSQKGRLLQLFLTMSLLSTTQIWIMLLLPTILCSRFERLANKLKTQVEHQVITKHKKEINRATIHHFNKKNFHHAYYTYGKARKTFLVFSKFCKFLFDFRFCKFYFFMHKIESSKGTSYLSWGFTPTLASGLLLLVGIISHLAVAGPPLLLLLLVHLLHGVESLAGVSFLGLGRINMLMQRVSEVIGLHPQFDQLLGEGPEPSG